MITTLWLADIGGIGGLRFRAPRASPAHGLRFSAGGVVTNLRRGLLPRLVPGRAAWFAVWDDEASLDRYVAERSPVVSTFAGGCRMRCTLDRIIQRNTPGFDDEHWSCGVPTGPVLVVTTSRPKLRWLARFLVAAVPTEQAAAASEGLRWAIGFSTPPGTFATVTLWDSATAAAAYAYGRQRPQHRRAMEIEAKRWFRSSLNGRMQVYTIEGDLAHGSPVPHLDLTAD